MAIFSGDRFIAWQSLFAGMTIAFIAIARPQNVAVAISSSRMIEIASSTKGGPVMTMAGNFFFQIQLRTGR